MQILGTLLAPAVSSLFGGGQQTGSVQSPGQLTPDQMANLQFAALNERNKLINYYSNAGIPYSSGLAYDLGSIPFQTAAAAGQIEQGQQSTAMAQNTNTANQLAQLGTTLGGLNQQGTNAQTQTNPDTSVFSTAPTSTGAGAATAPAVPYTQITGQGGA